MPASRTNAPYLRAKRDKLGHLLTLAPPPGAPKKGRRPVRRAPNPKGKRA
jgi:hypothetical protein